MTAWYLGDVDALEQQRVGEVGVGRVGEVILDFDLGVGLHQRDEADGAPGRASPARTATEYRRRAAACRRDWLLPMLHSQSMLHRSRMPVPQ